MRFILTFIAAAGLSTALFAQQPASDQDHAAHHPDGASAPVAGPKKAPAKPKSPAAKPGPATSASGAMGKGAGMGKMHDEAHKPGGMHDQMHGKDGKMMGHKAAMPASAASK